jgi:hypothetical protein
MASRAGLLQHPPMKAQINPGLSLSLDDKRGSRHALQGWDIEGRAALFARGARPKPSTIHQRI